MDEAWLAEQRAERYRTALVDCWSYADLLSQAELSVGEGTGLIVRTVRRALEVRSPAPARPATEPVECLCDPGDGTSECEWEGMCYEAWLDGRMVRPADEPAGPNGVAE